MGKVWSLLITAIVVIVLINIAIEAIRPFLPIIGLVLTGLILFLLFRLLFSRRKPWS